MTIINSKHLVSYLFTYLGVVWLIIYADTILLTISVMITEIIIISKLFYKFYFRKNLILKWKLYPRINKTSSNEY